MSEESPEQEDDAELETLIERDQKRARVNGEISKALDESYKHILVAFQHFDAIGQLALQAMTEATKARKAAVQAQLLLKGSKERRGFMAARDAWKHADELHHQADVAGQACVNGVAAGTKAGFSVSKAKALVNVSNPQPES